MPSDDIRISFNVTVPELDLSAELEQVQENITRALMVSPGMLERIREGRFPNVSMGCMVPAPAPCPECEEDTPIYLNGRRLRQSDGDGDVYPGVAEVTREDADAVVPQSLPEPFREALISQYLEASARAQQQVVAGIQVGRLWHPEYGNDLSALLVPPELPSGPVSGPLPPWCVEGSIVRHRPTGVDYSVVRGGPEVMLCEVTDSESPIAHILMRSAVINGSDEWQPHPLPLTKWQRLMQD